MLLLLEGFMGFLNAVKPAVKVQQLNLTIGWVITMKYLSVQITCMYFKARYNLSSLNKNCVLLNCSLR